MAIQRYVGIGRETVAYGTAANAVRYAEAIAKIKPSQGWVIPEPVARRDPQKANLGPYRARGNIGPFDAEPQNVFLDLLYGVLGKVTTTGTGPYTHQFRGEDSLPSYTLRLGVEKTERVLPGCLVESLSVHIPHDGNVEALAEILTGFPETKDSLATPTLSALKAFNHFTDPTDNIVTIATKDVKAQVYDLQLQIKNNIPFNRGALDGRNFSVKRYGKREITGKLSIAFDDTDEYDRFIAGTDFTLVAHIAGDIISGADRYSLHLEMGTCRYVGDAVPDVGPINEPVVIADAAFKSFYNTSYTNALEAAIVNSVSSL
jgi:hypothetical protein